MDNEAFVALPCAKRHRLCPECCVDDRLQRCPLFTAPLHQDNNPHHNTKQPRVCNCHTCITHDTTVNMELLDPLQPMHKRPSILKNTKQYAQCFPAILYFVCFAF